MTKPSKGPCGQSKRPYERPRLEPSEIFGAEAMAGTCCRGGTCSNAVRNTQRTTIDVNKQKTSTAS
jgi:hypothetical protein